MEPNYVNYGQFVQQKPSRLWQLQTKTNDMLDTAYSTVTLRVPWEGDVIQFTEHTDVSATVFKRIVSEDQK
jgi:hypothetical protein